MTEGAVLQLVRVLVVEDNPGDVFLLTQALENTELKLELTVLSDGGEALDYLGREENRGERRPDLAILDLNLPRFEGSEVLAAIRRDPVLADLLVVILTSSASPRDRQQIEKLGVARYLTKPSDLDAFLQLGSVFEEVLRERGLG